MDKKVEMELKSIEEAISTVVDHCKNFSSWVDDGTDLIEELQQTAMALHYLMETLKVKLALETFAGKS
jgi:prefoldin subunit 5